MTNTAETLRTEAAALRAEANGIGDHFGNCGPAAARRKDALYDEAVNEVCDNCGSPLVVVRSREGRFCTSECAEAFELS